MSFHRRVFLSHAWAGPPVSWLARDLERLGWRTWLDVDQQLHGSLDARLVDGIQGSDAVILCLSAAYDRKVHGATMATDGLVVDNCLKEFLLVGACGVPVVPAVCEPVMRSVRRWSPALQMRLAGHVYADVVDGRSALPVHRCLCGLFGGGPMRSVVLGRRQRRAVPTCRV